MVAARHGWHHPSHRGAWWTAVPDVVAPVMRAVAPRPAALLVAACALVSGSVVQATVHQISEDNIHRAAVAAEAAAEHAAHERRLRTDGAATTRLSGQATAYLAHRRAQAREVAEGAVRTADSLTSTAPDVVAPEDLAELNAAMSELSSLMARTPDADLALSRAAQHVALTAPADEPAQEPVADVAPAEVLPTTPLADAVELLEGAVQVAEEPHGSTGGVTPAASRSTPAASRSTTGQRPDASANTPVDPTSSEPVAATLETFATESSSGAPGVGTSGQGASASPAQDPVGADPGSEPVPLTPGSPTARTADVMGEGVAAASLLAAADLDLGDSERLEAAAERVMELSERMQAAVDAALAQQQAEEEARAKAAAEAASTAKRLERLVARADAAPNGAIPAAYLCGVDFDRTVQLRCDAAAALEQLNGAYVAANGRNLRVSSSYRTAEEQAALHEEKGDLAATAGTSNHGRGQAIDLAGAGVLGQFDAPLYLWLTAHAGDYGWHHPSYMDPGGAGPLEPWHWEYGTKD